MSSLHFEKKAFLVFALILFLQIHLKIALPRSKKINFCSPSPFSSQTEASALDEQST